MNLYKKLNIKMCSSCHIKIDNYHFKNKISLIMILRNSFSPNTLKYTVAWWGSKKKKQNSELSKKHVIWLTEHFNVIVCDTFSVTRTNIGYKPNSGICNFATFTKN